MFQAKKTQRGHHFLSAGNTTPKRFFSLVKVIAKLNGSKIIFSKFHYF